MAHARTSDAATGAEVAEGKGCGLTLRSTGRAGSCFLGGERPGGAPVTSNVKPWLQVPAIGLIEAYVQEGRIGVLLEIALLNPVVSSDALRALAHDLAMHIAACSPAAVDREALDPAFVAREMSFAKRAAEALPSAEATDKLARIRESLFRAYCLLKQPYLKLPELSVREYLANVSRELGATITIKRFIRYELPKA